MRTDGLRIAFVACTRNRHRYRDDPSYIYRCESLGLALEEAGHHVVFMHLTQVVASERVDIAVFHRPSMSFAFWLATRWLRLRGVRLMADMDDLVFVPALAEFSPAVLNGQLALGTVEQSFTRTRDALKAFACITTSTEPLAEHLREAFQAARVCVLPNAVHYRWLLEVVSQAPQPRANHDLGKVISYNPGTRSHDRDFDVYAPAIHGYLQKYPEAVLVVTGPLKLNLTARPGQIIHREKMPFVDYHRSFAGVWVNLAPLEPTPFTRCKSAVKIFEAGFWGTPTICSSIRDTQRFENAGAVFADDAASCLARLEALRDTVRYAASVAGLQERVKNIADANATASQFVAFVEERVL